MNLDRFSQPLAGEGREPSLEAIQEQQELNKRDIVQSYIFRYVDDCNRFPEVQDIQETFYRLDLSSNLIEHELNNLKEVLSLD